MADLDDLRFAHFYERCVHLKRAAFDTSPGGQLTEPLKGFDIRRPTIRITRIVHCIDPDEQVPGTEHFRPTQCQCQKNRITSWHIGHRYALPAVLRYGDARIRQGRAADTGQIELDDFVFHYAQ